MQHSACTTEGGNKKNVTGNQKQRNRNTQTAKLPCVTTANKEGWEIP